MIRVLENESRVPADRAPAILDRTTEAALAALRQPGDVHLHPACLARVRANERVASTARCLHRIPELDESRVPTLASELSPTRILDEDLVFLMRREECDQRQVVLPCRLGDQTVRRPGTIRPALASIETAY